MEFLVREIAAMFSPDRLDKTPQQVVAVDLLIIMVVTFGAESFFPTNYNHFVSIAFRAAHSNTLRNIYIFFNFKADFIY